MPCVYGAWGYASFYTRTMVVSYHSRGYLYHVPRDRSLCHHVDIVHVRVKRRQPSVWPLPCVVICATKLFSYGSVLGGVAQHGMGAHHVGRHMAGHPRAQSTGVGRVSSTLILSSVMAVCAPTRPVRAADVAALREYASVVPCAMDCWYAARVAHESAARVGEASQTYARGVASVQCFGVPTRRHEPTPLLVCECGHGGSRRVYAVRVRAVYATCARAAHMTHVPSTPYGTCHQRLLYRSCMSVAGLEPATSRLKA